MRLRLPWFLILLLVFAPSTGVWASEQAPPSYRAGARDFVARMTRRGGFDEQELRALLDQARYQQSIIDAIRRPWEAKPWYKYRKIFLTPKRVAGGVDFWRANQALLDRARAELGVPPEMVTAIIGVETNYGSNLGKHRVIDALTTLGFSYPRRAGFFRKELEELLLLTREERLGILGLKGSYAGAVGLPQFIPSSYRAYAVDFDGDGRRDLWNSRADAIGSVANYFVRHGWMPGEPVALRARVKGSVPRGIQVAGKKPRKPDMRIATLEAAGVLAEGPLDAAARASLIRLEAPEEEYWLGLKNFYVITRYNHSNLYAMAVYQLSREIEEQFRAGP